MDIFKEIVASSILTAVTLIGITKVKSRLYRSANGKDDHDD